MTTPTPEAIEAAARALFDDNPVWHLVHDRPALWSEVVESAKDRYRQQARAALTAAAPFIAAQAKAEALREAADALEAGWSYGAELNYDGSEKPGVAAAIQMTHENAETLRARAATIESEPTNV